MNPKDRDAEKQWQRESFNSREVAGRQIATHTDNRVDVMVDGEKIAFSDRKSMRANKHGLRQILRWILVRVNE